MTNIHSIHERPQSSIDLEEARVNSASEWVARLDRGLSKSEKQSLGAWLASTPENMQELLEVAHLWDKMHQLERLSDLFPQNSTAKETSYAKRWTGA